MPWLICEKSTEYESIAYLSYQKKAELIKLENGIKLNRQTVYYHESTYSESLTTNYSIIQYTQKPQHTIL